MLAYHLLIFFNDAFYHLKFRGLHTVILNELNWVYLVLCTCSAFCHMHVDWIMFIGPKEELKSE